MSETTDRAALAAAANTVGGIRVAANYVQTTEAGAGFVRLVESDYSSPFGPINEWQVIVLTPADAATAETWLASKRPALVAALAPVMKIKSVRLLPVQFGTGAPIPCAFITGNREED